MDVEILLLLAVPAAFLLVALGWFAARVDIKHLLEGSRQLPRSYFRGLNHLLNEQPDRAIDSFIEALKADPETVELHFTLGAMFRRRGETERAIRIHQSLLARSNLPQSEREKAQLEIGLDYLKAGMLDRAEDAFVSLRDGLLKREALESLVDVYEIEKEWSKAIEAARELERVSDVDQRKRISHYWCEIAQSALARSSFDDALNALDRAHQEDRTNVRATLLRGDWLAAQGRYDEAIDAWLAIEKQSVVHLALVAERVLNAHKTLGRTEQGLHLLRNMLAQSPSIDVLETAHRETVAHQGPESAHELVLAELKRAPTLIGLDKLVESRLTLAPAPLVPELELVKTLLHQHTRRLSRYTCGHCGFKARQFYWQCPGCRTWDAYVPRRTEELEAMR
ncbi:MAG TPA: lipopolysaccharide assembly protein LapB [Burkholderiaceae bacterium]|nr:lipopolysaccharide assembly protein LapB [Burkholderiaceae bacterium]